MSVPVERDIDLVLVTGASLEPVPKLAIRAGSWRFRGFRKGIDRNQEAVRAPKGLRENELAHSRIIALDGFEQVGACESVRV
jgi:hypothetical protein